VRKRVGEKGVISKFQHWSGAVSRFPTRFLTEYSKSPRPTVSMSVIPKIEIHFKLRFILVRQTTAGALSNTGTGTLTSVHAVSQQPHPCCWCQIVGRPTQTTRKAAMTRSSRRFYWGRPETTPVMTPSHDSMR
jgi:hypothetical protein